MEGSLNRVTDISDSYMNKRENITETLLYNILSKLYSATTSKMKTVFRSGGTQLMAGNAGVWYLAI